MALTYIERYLGRVANVAATTVTFQLPREHLYSRLALHFVLPTAAANYVAAAELLGITRVEVIANGQLVLKSYSWADLVEMNKYVTETSTDYRVAVTAAKTAGYASAIIGFSLTSSDLSTLLPSYLFTSLDLKITWNTFAIMGGDAGAPYVDVFSRELLFTPELRGLKYAFNKETSLSYTASAVGFTNTDLTIGNVYRRIFVRTFGGLVAAAGVAAEDAVTDIEVVQDGVIYHRKTTWLGNVIFNKGEYHFETKPVGAGMIYFDTTNDGAATVDSAPFSSWKLRMSFPDVTTHAASASIIPQELIYPRG